MEAPPLDAEPPLAQVVGLAHLQALFLSLDAVPPPPTRRRARPAPAGPPPQTRRERDESSEYYVYLLVSQHACVFKLGHTRRLHERLRSLRGQHGEFLAADSYLVKVPSKRLARWIETRLKTYFNDPEWRAEAPRPYPNRSYNDVGGLQEWYHLPVFTAMQATLFNLLQPDFDQEHPLYEPHPAFVPPGGMNLTEALVQAAALLPSAVPPPPPNPEEVARQRAREAGAAWLAYSEANFEQVRAWVHHYWLWMVARSPVGAAADGARRCTLYFSRQRRDPYPPELGPDPCPQRPPTHWHDLCAFAHLRLRTREGEDVERRYFEPVLGSESGGTLAVTFVLDALCEQESACFNPPTDLPQRIRRWLVGLGGSEEDEAKVAAT